MRGRGDPVPRWGYGAPGTRGRRDRGGAGWDADGFGGGWRVGVVFVCACVGEFARQPPLPSAPSKQPSTIPPTSLRSAASPVPRRNRPPPPPPPTEHPRPAPSPPSESVLRRTKPTHPTPHAPKESPLTHHQNILPHPPTPTCAPGPADTGRCSRAAARGGGKPAAPKWFRPGGK